MIDKSLLLQDQSQTALFLTEKKKQQSFPPSTMSKMLLTSSTKSLIPSPNLNPIKSKLQIPKITFQKQQIAVNPQWLKLTSSTTFKTLIAIATTATTLTFAPPSLAADIEKAALFDFDATLPIIAAEFLFLMVTLDKLYYSPLGNFMDERDASIKAKLAGVKDTSKEVKQLDDQATAIMRAARAEITAALNKMKKETTAEVEAKIAEGRKKVEAELQEALGKLEKQKEETISALDSQIATLSEDIVKKVLPI